MRNKSYGPGNTKVKVLNSIIVEADIFEEQDIISQALTTSNHADFLSTIKKIDCSCCRVGRMCSANNGTSKVPVSFSGASDAYVLFVGEAPGVEEWKNKIPFVGKSGTILRNLVHKAGFPPSKIAFANTLMCRPYDTIGTRELDRKPLNDEVQACMGFLLKQISLINPFVIVAVGRTAAVNLFGFKSAPASAPMEDIKGIPFKLSKLPLSRNGKPYHPYGYVIYHPASTMGSRDTNNTRKVALKQDIDKLLEFLKNPTSFPLMSGKESWFSKSALV